MRHSCASKAIFIFAIIFLCLSGCRNLAYWKKSDPKPQQNAILTKDSEVASFNDFRTIDASMVEPPEKKHKSMLWENSQARDIERRLGVVYD